MATLKARPIKYDADTGLEIWGYSAPDLECTPFVGTVMARHIDTDPDTGIEIWARAKECCDATTTDYVLSGTCWTSPGLSENMVGHVVNTGNCQTAQCNDFTLAWDSGASAWLGSFNLRNGTINIKVECDPLKGPTDNGKFLITPTAACLGALSGVPIESLFYCEDPVAFTFTQLVVSECCGCPATGPPFTGEAASITIIFILNCAPFKLCRWIDVDADTGLEIWGYGELCTAWNEKCGDNTCDEIHCDLVLTVDTDDPDCNDAIGTYVMYYVPSVSPYWTVDIPINTGILTVQFYCDGGNDIHIHAFCGVDSADVYGHADDPENIDETLDLVLTHTPIDCGKCRWICDDSGGAGIWVPDVVNYPPDGNTCDALCGTTPDCDAQLTALLLAGTLTEPCVGGNVYDEDCGTEPGADCCIGTLHMRITR